MAKKEKESKKEEVKVEIKVDEVVRPGGGLTVDNRKTSRRFQ